jgi:DNA-binding PadR family transcriptional regulator
MSTIGNVPILDLDHCPCSGGTLDKLIQPAILAVLAGGPLHGYRLVERIGQMPMLAGRRPDASGVYRLLKSMEARGLLSASWDLSESGPAKRLYRLMPAGTECLLHWIQTLEEYRRSVSALLELSREAIANSQGEPNAG